MEELPDTHEAGQRCGDGEQGRFGNRTRRGIRGSQNTPKDSVHEEPDDGADDEGAQGENAEGGD